MIWPRPKRRPLSIDDAVWRGLDAELPWLRRLDAPRAARLRELVAMFLSTKTISGADGLVPTDRMRLLIATQACLPVLRLGLEPYEDFVEIVVYPASFAVHRRITDEDGLVHEFDDVLAGEAMHRGPVVLSWDDVAGDDRDPTVNVVIHEFAHKLDMSDGEADGCPPMPSVERAGWLDMIGEAYDDFVDVLERVEASIPRDIDPESEEADDFYARLPLDPYAATDIAEFFAVATEVHFLEPERLRDAFPRLAVAFGRYFGPA